jgi:hypothetical protein
MTEIVPPPADPSINSEGVQHFDSTSETFDNKVYVCSITPNSTSSCNFISSATEFLAGTPNNPLAFGFNETTRSDFRIFSSDGNQTISQ